MMILTILGFVLFAVFATIGAISVAMQLKKLDEDHKALVSSVKQQKEKEAIERLQYLAGIKLKTEINHVPAKLGPDIVGELLAESEIEVLKELEEKKISKQYTRR